MADKIEKDKCVKNKKKSRSRKKRTREVEKKFATGRAFAEKAQAPSERMMTN